MRGAYLFRLNWEPPATAAKIKPAAPSASIRIVSTGIPIASCANSPSNNAVAAAAIKVRKSSIGVVLDPAQREKPHLRRRHSKRHRTSAL